MILNIISGNIYVGSSRDMECRFRAHKSLLQKGKHHSIYLQRSWDKYGYDNFYFIILEFCDFSQLLIKEKYYFDKLKPEYNIATDPQAPMVGKKHSEEIKISLAKPGELNGMWGRNHDRETRLKISTNRKKAQMTPETRLAWIEKLKAQKGYWLGKKIPQEVTDKQKMTLRNKFPKIGCSNGRIYDCQLDAAKDLNIKQGHISEQIKGLRQSVKGYKFWKIK